MLRTNLDSQMAYSCTRCSWLATELPELETLQLHRAAQVVPEPWLLGQLQSQGAQMFFQTPCRTWRPTPFDRLDQLSDMPNGGGVREHWLRAWDGNVDFSPRRHRAIA